YRRTSRASDPEGGIGVDCPSICRRTRRSRPYSRRAPLHHRVRVGSPLPRANRQPAPSPRESPWHTRDRSSSIYSGDEGECPPPSQLAGASPSQRGTSPSGPCGAGLAPPPSSAPFRWLFSCPPSSVALARGWIVVPNLMLLTVFVQGVHT